MLMAGLRSLLFMQIKPSIDLNSQARTHLCIVINQVCLRWELVDFYMCSTLIMKAVPGSFAQSWDTRTIWVNEPQIFKYIFLIDCCRWIVPTLFMQLYMYMVAQRRKVLSPKTKAAWYLCTWKGWRVPRDCASKTLACMLVRMFHGPLCGISRGLEICWCLLAAILHKRVLLCCI